jgi:hypothetical protein
VFAKHLVRRIYRLLDNKGNYMRTSFVSRLIVRQSFDGSFPSWMTLCGIGKRDDWDLFSYSKWENISRGIGQALCHGLRLLCVNTWETEIICGKYNYNVCYKFFCFVIAMVLKMVLKR